MLLSGSGEAFISGENQDVLVTWRTGKSLLGPDPFSLVPFLTTVLPDPDHSALDGEHRLPPQMQELREHIQGGEWLFCGQRLWSVISVCRDSRGLLAPSFPI